MVGKKRIADRCCNALHAAGHESYAVYNGLSGLLTAENRRPEVVLIDLAMPNMDGIDLANAIRTSEDLQEMLLIALYDEKDDFPAYRKSLEVAFDRSLLKPIDLPQLADAIQAAWRLTHQSPSNNRKYDRAGRREDLSA